MRVADWIIESLFNLGLRKIFGVTGGAVVHLFDAASKNEKIETTFLNHEQTASFAVEAYVKLTSEISACIVTTGPGATNAITGLSAAWLDSIPAIYISGQARSNLLINGRRLRQVGTQEIDIIPVVSSLTKYAKQIKHINEVKSSLIKALIERKKGRPGPVWLDIPVDILWSEYNESLLTNEDIILNEKKSEVQIIKNKLSKLLKTSQRPLLLLGGGCRSPEIKNLQKIINSIGIPFVTSWLGYDLIPVEDNLHIGHVGMSGQRGANIAIGNCDLLISIGTSLSTSITTTRTERFASNAIRVNINCDPDDFTHTCEFFHYNFVCEAEIIINSLKELENNSSKDWIEFNKICKRISQNEKIQEDKYIHPFEIFRLIPDNSPPNSIFVSDGGGTTVYSSFQAIYPRKQQRMILSCGLCSMGSGIPESIGVAHTKRPTFLFCGDGSFPFNVQDLQVIKNKNLPIIITIFSNKAYLSIRTTQNDFLDKNL